MRTSPTRSRRRLRSRRRSGGGATTSTRSSTDAPPGCPGPSASIPAHRPPNTPDAAFYQPTFLYESIWDVGVAILLVWIDRKWHPNRGRLFAIYVAAYTAGRAVVEALRDDHANRFLGLRLNDWVSLIVFLGALVYLWIRRDKPGDSDLGAGPEETPAPEPSTNHEADTALRQPPVEP